MESSALLAQPRALSGPDLTHDSTHLALDPGMDNRLFQGMQHGGEFCLCLYVTNWISFGITRAKEDKWPLFVSCF